MKNYLLIISIIWIGHISSQGQVQIDLQQLRLLNLGNTDSNLGIIWGENDNDTFGLTYDGVGSEGDNVLHLKEHVGSSSIIMSFKANGRVGIGTQDPLFKTVIKATGNAIRADSVDISNLAMVLEKGSNNDNEGIGMGFQSSSTRSTLGAAIIFERSGGSSKGHLHFATKASSNADEDIPIRMTIDKDGMVGIGTVAPSAPVHINDFMKLEPRTSAPSCLSAIDEGRIYYDRTLKKFRGCVSFSSTAQVSHGWISFH